MIRKLRLLILESHVGLGDENPSGSPGAEAEASLSKSTVLGTVSSTFLGLRAYGKAAGTTQYRLRSSST